MDAQFIASILAQFPVVALVVWLFMKFRDYENESRGRWFAYMRDRDLQLKETLEEFSQGGKAVAAELKTVGLGIATLNARLKG